MKPYLKNIRTNEVHKGVVRRLYEHDLDEIMRVQEDAMSTITDSATYVPGTRADILNLLEHGEIHGMFANGVLCGVCGICSSVFLDNLGMDIGFSDDQCANSATLDFYFVTNDYRSNAIGRELARICVERAETELNCSYVLATISPKNIGSLLTMMSINGFRIKAMRQKYGCKLRYIMCYERASTRLYTYYERFSVFDVYEISHCLANGYEGIATFKNDEGIFVWLAK